jgi:hypothetical protein
VVAFRSICILNGSVIKSQVLSSWVFAFRKSKSSQALYLQIMELFGALSRCYIFWVDPWGYEKAIEPVVGVLLFRVYQIINICIIPWQVIRSVLYNISITFFKNFLPSLFLFLTYSYQSSGKKYFPMRMKIETKKFLPIVCHLFLYL